jgi:two-component system LytT family response regulator
MNHPLSTLIIDDEILARERLIRLLGSFNNTFTIIGEAADGDQAFEKINALKPDIVFLDVQMPGMDVFEMLTQIVHKPFIVFCTAYDHYALKAFESHSVDYIVKPVELDRLKKTVEKLQKITKANDSASIQKLVETLRSMDQKPVPISIPHKVGDKTILIRLDSVVYFEADDKYVHFYNPEGTRYLTDQSLKLLEEKLPNNFIRISKSVIINKNFVKEIHKYFRGRLQMVMDTVNKTRLASGSAFTDALKESFEL